MVSVYEATRFRFPEESNIHVHCGVELRIHRINPKTNNKGRGYSRDTAVRVYTLKAYGVVTSTLNGHECSASRPGHFTCGRSHPLPTE